MGTKATDHDPICLAKKEKVLQTSFFWINNNRNERTKWKNAHFVCLASSPLKKLKIYFQRRLTDEIERKSWALVRWAFVVTIELGLAALLRLLLYGNADAAAAAVDQCESVCPSDFPEARLAQNKHTDKTTTTTVMIPLLLAVALVTKMPVSGWRAPMVDGWPTTTSPPQPGQARKKISSNCFLTIKKNQTNLNVFSDPEKEHIFRSRSVEPDWRVSALYTLVIESWWSCHEDLSSTVRTAWIFTRQKRTTRTKQNPGHEFET